MSENRPSIKVTKIVDTYEAIHVPTRLRTYDLNRDMACFKLGQLVEKQMTFEFIKKENDEKQMGTCT